MSASVSNRRLEEEDEGPESSGPPAKRLKSSASTEEGSKPGRVEKFSRSEESVGITEYLSPDHVGFQGLLKQRYTDFLVNEIDKDGNVLKLKSLVPEKRESASAKEPKVQSDTPIADATKATENGSAKTTDVSDEKAAVGNPALTSNGNAKSSELAAKPPAVEIKPFELDDADRALLISWLGSDTTDVLLKLHSDILAIEREIKPGYKIVTPETKLLSSKPIDDKDARALLHRSIRRIFSGKIETSTTDEYNIEFWAKKISGAKPEEQQRHNENKKKQARQPIESWDQLGGEYLHFNLYKENKDTMECLHLLGKFLKLPPKSFTIAGTKDRRAVTVQRVCVHRLKAERLSSINPKLKGLKAGDFEYKTFALDLGDLKGNEFKITLRDCVFPEGSDINTVVENGVSTLRERGFINYYGMQRFGTFAISTHEVGKAMLHGDWKRAIELVMAYDEDTLINASPDERKRAVACKQWFEDTMSAENAAEAFKLMPGKFVSESSILKWFTKPHEVGNWLGALQKIPRNLRLMFVHAYQSYIWNTVASERLKRYGSTIRAGDLVIMSASEVAASKPAVDLEEEGIEEYDEDRFVRARPVTAEEVDVGRFTIYDTVIPSPGWDVVYPENDLRDVYAEVMGKDGLDPFNMIRNQKDLSMAGHYRRLLYKPERVEWEIKRYTGFADQLVETDLMYVQRQRQKARGKLLSTDEGLVQEAIANPTGPRLGVIIKLTLGTSQYATMALRELTKGGIIATLVAPAPEAAKQEATGAEDVEMQNS